MNLVWFSYHDIEYPRSGGAERTVFEIGRRLVRRGVSFNWVTCRFPYSSSEALVEGIHIARVGNPASAHLRLFSLLRSLRPDVVVDDLSHVIPWATEVATNVPGTAFFHHLHARTLRGQVNLPVAIGLAFLEKQYRLLFPTWPFVTEGVQAARDLTALGVSGSRVVRILPGVDLDRFHPLPKYGCPTLVYFGGFRDYKRPWVPVQLYRKLSESVKNLQLLMVGSGPSLSRVKSFAKDADGIEFLGRLSSERLAEVVSQSWLNVHTSVSEGWGFSILEASAAGTPTVAYAVPGVSESVSPGVNGDLVPDDNLDALTASAAEVLANPQVWITRSRNIAKQYSWDSAATLWRDHLASVAVSSPAAGTRNHRDSP